MTKRKVERALFALGIPAGNKGFVYIRDIIILYDKPEWRNVKIGAMYYKLAKQYKTTWYAVERNIRYALAFARENSPRKDLVEHYIGFDYPQNMHSLKMLYHVLKTEKEGAA